MIKQIKTLEDIAKFAKLLHEEGLSFHPDNDFNNCVNLETEEKTYSKEEADLRNELMNQCFKVCEEHNADLYDIMSEVVLKESGLDKLIPLPSASCSDLIN